MPRKSKKDNLKEKKESRKGLKTVSAPFHFPRHKTSFYCNYKEVQLISLVLQSTGLRISEVLRLSRPDLLADNRIHVKSLKRSIERIITVDPYIYQLLISISGKKDKLFSTTYHTVYKYIKSGKSGMRLIKNDKNFSVCHSARKHWIRNQIYNLKRTVGSVVRELGWQKKTSILYYLK